EPRLMKKMGFFVSFKIQYPNVSGIIRLPLNERNHFPVRRPGFWSLVVFTCSQVVLRSATIRGLGIDSEMPSARRCESNSFSIGRPNRSSVMSINGEAQKRSAFNIRDPNIILGISHSDSHTFAVTGKLKARVTLGWHLGRSNIALHVYPNRLADPASHAWNVGGNTIQG